MLIFTERAAKKVLQVTSLVVTKYISFLIKSIINNMTLSSVVRKCLLCGINSVLLYCTTNLQNQIKRKKIRYGKYQQLKVSVNFVQFTISDILGRRSSIDYIYIYMGERLVGEKEGESERSIELNGLRVENTFSWVKVISRQTRVQEKTHLSMAVFVWC